MTGALLATYVTRLLGEDSYAVPSSRSAQIYDAINDSRNLIRQSFIEAAPIVLKQFVTLVVNVGNNRLYDWPAATKDPFTALSVRSITNQEELSPAARINEDEGHYVWRNIKQLELADGIEPPGGLEVECVIDVADIDSSTTEANIGLPTGCHRLIGKGARMLLKEVPESAGGRAEKAFMREVQALSTIYASYDANGGEALRHALMASYGRLVGDMLY